MGIVAYLGIPYFRCVNLVGPRDVCDDRDEMKVMNSELGRTQMDCTSSMKSHSRRNRQGRKEGGGSGGGGGDGGDGDDGGFCFSSRCVVTANDTSCVRDRLPVRYELKEVVCEKCVEGRVKVRPVVETRNVCRTKRENFCLDVVDKEVRWRKWCRPLSYRQEKEFGTGPLAKIIFFLCVHTVPYA